MKTKTRFHKLTAWLLTLAMLMTFIPTFSQIGTGLTVYATEGTGSDSDDSELGGGTGDGGSEAGSGGSSGTEGDGTAVSYLAPVYENGEIKLDANNDVVFETKTVTDYNVAEDIAYGGTITSADKMPTVGTSGKTAWYVADSDIEWENFVLVQGDVHLIVCDDVTVTSLYGIVVSDGNSLTIYGQENGTGTLVAKGMKYSEGFYSAAIGGCDVTTEMANGGTITINGCQITATASSNAAAIGGGNGGHGGNIIINGGTVSANATAYSAAIGGGSRGNSGNITINGGIVSAETSGSSSAIGAGYVRYSSTGESILAKTDKIEINGGTVVATHTDSYEEYPVIGGLYGFDNINISGGHITVNHASSAGIGIGTNSVTVMEFDGNLNISGGTIISGNDKTLYLGAGKTSSSAKGTVNVVVTGGNISGTFKNVSTLKDGENDVEMKEITIDGAEDQTEVTVLEDYPTYGLRDVVTDGDKVVIYVPASKAYAVTISDTIANGTVTADVSEASEGDTVTLTVTPAENYDIDTVTYNDGISDVEITATGGVYSFTMPASNVAVTAVFKESVTYVASVTTAGEGGVTENYSSLTDAIAAAKENEGSTLKLLENVDTHVLIDGGTFTLDLNGHNIEADTLFDSSFITRMNALTIWNDANITLEGSGSIVSNCILDNSSTTFCYCIYNRGKLKIDGDIELKTNEYRYNSGVYSYNGQLTIDNCRINATMYAISCYKSNTTINGGNFQSNGTCLNIDNANVTVKGGSFTGEGYDCYVHASSNPSTLKLGAGDDGSGPIFPGGIIVSNTVSLSDLLDENCYFKQNVTSVDMTNITTEITGDVSVAYCDHSKNTNTIPTADDEFTHSLFCSDCGAIVSHGNHSLDGGICTGCGYGCSHSSCITENNVTKCAQCPVVLVAQVGDAYFAKLSDAVAAANDTNGSTLTLLADVKGDFTVDTNSVFTLDLNGKPLRGTSNGSIITVDNGAELTIKSSASGGKITGCDNQNVNGTIFVSGTLKLESGEITGNSVEYGGGVVVADGTFVMNGGEITGNTVKYCGGGVYMLGNGSFTMNGGSISDNVVRIDDKNMQIEGFPGGGGVFIRQGTFTMNDGTISANRSVYTRGGGVQVSGYGTFIMNGGSVTGNSALEKGGGVYVMNGWDNEPAGSFTVNGNSVISGNTVNGDANNVYLEAPLSIGSNLSTTAGIGITGSTTPTDSGVEIASSGATEINKSAFISDNINYSIVQKEGKLYLYPHIHSWNYELDGTNTNTIKATCQAASCPEAGAKTIVISASDKVYDGTAVTATVTNNVDSTDYSASIVYEAKKGSLTDGKAVNVGTYTAKITVGGVTASVEFEITPVIYTVTVTDDGNGTASASPVSGAEGTEVTLTANPKEGYKFKEWQVTPDTVTVENNRFTMPAGNVTVTAIFETIPPTITAVYKSGTTHYIEWTASVPAGSGRTLTSVTVNGYELLDEENATTKNASVEIRYGGKYTFAVTDSTGNTASVELDIDIPVTFPADSITVVDNWSADKLYHRGEAIIDSSKLSGGAYDPSKITADGGAALAPKDYTGGYGYFQMVVNGVPEDFNIETEIIPWFEDIMWRDVTESSVGALKTANHIIVLQSLFDELNPDLIAWQFITVRDNKIKIESMSNSDMLNNQPGSITATFTGGHTGKYEAAILPGNSLTSDAFKDSAVVWQPVQNGTITLDGLNDGTYQIAVRAKYEEADAYGSVNSNYWHGLVISEPVVIRSVYPITLEAVPAAGGSITASVESAENNEEFDVTITVEDEYAIQGLYYVDDDGGEVAFATSDYSSIQTAGTHTIRMPKRGATTIRVKFAPKVIFKDWDDTILSEQYVSYGSAATAPQNPARENWKFIGWDKAFDNVTEPLTVMARYEEKIVVSVPDIASKVYNGSAQTATVPESQYYTVKANNGGINAGEYDVVLELTDSEGYRWNTTNEKTVSMKFNITKAQAVITVDDTPIVKTYGEALTLPTATTNFGTVSADKTVADMENAGEYTVTYTVAGNDNYNGDTKTVSVTINPKKIDKPYADNTSFVYDGNEHTYNVAASDYYTITGNKMTNAGSQTVTVALKDKVNYTWNDGKIDDVIFTFTIAKKDITGATVGNFEEITYTGGVQTPFATVTIDGLIVTGTWSDVTNVADKTTFTANGNFTGTIADKETGMLKANSSVATVPGANALTYSEAAQELVTAGVANGGTLKYSLDNSTWVDAIPTGTNADTYEVWYKVFGDANHNDTDSVKVDVTIAKKSIEAVTVALDGTLTYTGAEQTQNVTVTLDGFTVTFDVTDNKATNVKADGNYTLKVTANGNFTGEKTLEWNIAKADHIIEGENIPTASRIRRGNKLSTSTITPAELKDADGNVLGTFTWVTPDDEMTETGDFVKQVKFTPTDTNNYNEKTFDVTVNVYRPSSGGGGSSSNTTTTTTKNEDGSTTKVTENKTTGTKTEVTTNTDGSTTTVETKKDGTVTTTEKDNEGNTTTTVENPDGTSTTTEKNKDGSEKVTEEKADGTTVTTEKDTDGTKTVTTENTDGSKTTEETKKDGTKVTTETTADGETKTEIDLPKDKETEVTIPVDSAEDVTSVTVTDKDGKETEITDFEITEDGVKLTVSGDCTAVINQAAKKEFVDVHPVNHWATADIDYVYINGLMMGTSENHFSPDVPLTRAMLVTVLYRLEGEPRVSGITSFADLEKGQYYLDAVCWAQVNGIVNGVTETEFAPNDNITREQIAAIMHRYAQYKGFDVTQGGMLVREYNDYEAISDYALSSMTWAVNAGLLKGKGNNNLAPQDNATRAEVAAILHRFIEANK